MPSVIKANGSVEAYDEGKVIASIKRAGIPVQLQAEVLSHVRIKLYDNIPTSEIYHHIVEFLGRSPYPYTKSSYGLKQAIMDLGPTGYPFEDFIAEILKTQGYVTKVRQTLQGTCISHEIDVIAEKDDMKAMIEAKFHNRLGARSEVHVALYTKARFDDIKEKHGFTEAWIVTNTKATTDAITYAQCIGMTVISWSYPDDGSLRDLIERSKLQPITMLGTLSPSHKATLLENHVVLCKALLEHPSLLDNIPLSTVQKEQVLAEAAFICRKGNKQ